MTPEEVYQDGYEDFKRGGKRIPPASLGHRADYGPQKWQDWFRGWDAAEKETETP
jgi:hypothetical protein